MPLKENIAYSAEYEKYVDQFSYIFHNVYFTHQEVNSLSDNYKVVIDHFNHTYNISEKAGYSISCQLIVLMNRFEKKIYEYKSVFGKSFHYYLVHSNHNEYFICGNGLNQYAIFNITKNVEHIFADKCIVGKQWCNSEFWYIWEMQYNPKNNLLFINGQDMMNCPTVTIADLTNPEVVPLKTKNLGSYLVTLDNEYAFCKALSWNVDNSLTLEVGEEDPVVMNLTEMQIIEIMRDLI